MDLEVGQELQRALARASFLALQGEEWTTAHRSVLQAGGGSFERNHFIRPDGSKDSVPTPREVGELWPRLRAAMTDGDAGTWLSAELEITPQGRMQYTFNWDRRPWMNTRAGLLDPPEHRTTGPTDEDWREDLRLHPRSAERTPDWLAAIVAAGPPEPVPGPEADVTRMEQRFGALLAQPGWPDLGAAVVRHTVDRLRSGAFVWSDPTDLPEGDPEVERLVQEVVSAILREQLDPMPADRLRGLYLGALAAGVAPKVLDGPPVVQGDPAAASDKVVRDTVIEVVAQLTEALIDRG